MGQHQILADHFSVDESDIHYEKKENEYGEFFEVYVKEYRVGTGLSHTAVTADAVKNGQYALDKAKARE